MACSNQTRVLWTSYLQNLLRTSKIFKKKPDDYFIFRLYPQKLFCFKFHSTKILSLKNNIIFKKMLYLCDIQ